MASKTITDSAVERMPMRSELRDKGLKGFGVRATKDSKTFFIMYTIPGGKRRRMTLGTFPLVSADEAREAAEEIKREVRAGRDPFAEDKRADTFNELADLYLESPQFIKLAPKWQGIVRSNLSVHVRPFIGHRPVKDIQRSEIIRVLDKAVVKSESMANTAKRIISKIFNWGFDRGHVESRVIVDRLPMPATLKSRDRVITEEEIRTFWNGVNNLNPPHLLFKLMLATGQRAGELMKLRWEDVREDGWFTLRDTKNGTDHEVYAGEVGGEILDRLREITGKGEWVFPAARSDASQSHMTNHTTSWSRLRKELGFDHEDRAKQLNAHDLRRSMATLASETTAAHDQIIGQILNHKRTSVTAIYNRNEFKNEVVVTVDAWHRRLRQIISGEKAKVLAFGS